MSTTHDKPDDPYQHSEGTEGTGDYFGPKAAESERCVCDSLHPDYGYSCDICRPKKPASSSAEERVEKLKSAIRQSLDWGDFDFIRKALSED